MSETEIMRAILVAVSALPETMVWRNNTGQTPAQGGRVIRFGLPGSPDILGVHRGQAVGIEVKTSTGRQSQQQLRFQVAFEAAAGTYIIARSVPDALDALERLI
jgi:hypothetical protein